MYAHFLISLHHLALSQNQGFFEMDGDANVKFDDDEEDDDPAAVKSPLGEGMRRYSRRTSRKSASDRPSIVIESNPVDSNKNSAFVHTFNSSSSAAATAAAANTATASSSMERGSMSNSTTRKSRIKSHGKSKVSFKDEPSHKEVLKKRSSMLRNLFGGSSSKKETLNELGTELSSKSSTKSLVNSPASISPTSPQPPSISSSPSPAVIMEGYMSKRIAPGDNNTVSSMSIKVKEWENQYFVLYSTGNIFYYRGRQDFRTDASKNALNDRPIAASMYKLVFSSPSSASETASVISDASSLRIVLRPKRGEARDWYFRLATENDFELWVQALSKFCERGDFAEASL